MTCNYGKRPLVVWCHFEKKCSENKQKSGLIEMNWKMGLLIKMLQKLRHVSKTSFN